MNHEEVLNPRQRDLGFKIVKVNFLKPWKGYLKTGFTSVEKSYIPAIHRS